tara:strand:- start:404 stop:535 length:132 start_codon:yes stop_codon:yes gene_type:complete
MKKIDDTCYFKEDAIQKSMLFKRVVCIEGRDKDMMKRRRVVCI